jgi:single-stranded-DNA-specific exonuclease
MARGSARSVEGVDIHAAIAAHKRMLYRCGGHPMAAGLSLEGTRIDEFRRALWRTLERTARPPAEPEIQLDALLRLDQISPALVRAVDTLSPYGLGNEPPVFAVRDLTLASSAIIGRTREHRRLVVRTRDVDARDAEAREQTVLWWRSADQSPPEGPFDLAFTVGINRFRGEESVQLTWVDARAIAPPIVEVVAKPAIAVLDHRQLADRSLVYSQAALRALVAPASVADTGVGGRTLVWGEGVLVGDAQACAAPAGIALVDRNALHEAERLVIWTSPPGPDELYGALDTVSPREVALFCLDPGLDAPRAFLQRLAGMVKYALREYEGRVSLAELAAALAHHRWTARLGLEWMALKGQVDLTWEGNDVVLRVRDKTSSPSTKRLDMGLAEALRERTHVVEGQLRAQLEETAAYRAYARQASAERLVGGSSRVVALQEKGG